MKGDRTDLSFDRVDVDAVKRARAARVPVVVVLFSGRPLILDPIINDVDALIAAWLPGSEGDGITDVLFGAFDPKGRLPVTWPRSMSQIPINAAPGAKKPSGALFDYGFGLSYK
jgi:beta-glucosidase